jgi:flagellar hook protein FlgE
MGLFAVFQTSLSGMALAETALDVGANNVANANTPGFKASRIAAAAQTPQTQSLGSAPTSSSGGANPLQVGRGVQVAAIEVDHSQGTIELSANPAHLALNGQGMFILQARDGTRTYSRDGRFSLNAEDELVAADGSSVLGYAVGDNGELDTTQLRTLRIKRGSLVATQTGSASLRDYTVTTTGRIKGRYSDGQWRDLGQLRLARFANPRGLEQRAENRYAEGPASGAALESDPGESAAATIVPGAIERSNTDIGRELVSSLVWDMHFRANVAVSNSASSLLGELLSLRRA